MWYENKSTWVLVTLFFVFVSLFCCAANWVSRIYEETATPEKAVARYEWYETQFRDIKAAEGQLKDAEESVTRFKKDSGESKEWRFDQREEYARLNVNLQGLKSYRRSLIEAYNAKAAMITRNMWKSSTLPHQIEQ